MRAFSMSGSLISPESEVSLLIRDNVFEIHEKIEKKTKLIHI